MNKNRLKAMLIEAEAELNEAEGQILYLRQVVAGLKGLLGDDLHVDVSAEIVDAAPMQFATAKPPGYGEMTATEAFRTAIMAHPNRAMSMKALWPEIKKNLKGGYTAPRNAVNAAARRLSEDQTASIKRLPDTGEYIYTVPQEIPVPNPAADADARIAEAFKTANRLSESAVRGLQTTGGTIRQNAPVTTAERATARFYGVVGAPGLPAGQSSPLET